jgi:hypothetical protein
VALPDLVYRVRGNADGNTELRYSLRSVAQNAAGLFGKVWIFGQGLPDWLRNVEVVDAGNPEAGRTGDVRAKLEAAVVHPGVADRIVLMDDDFFLVEPITEWAAYHMGPTSEYLTYLTRFYGVNPTGSSSWVKAMRATAEWMADRGYGDILCRQGHRPLLWDKTKLAGALAEYPDDRPLDMLGLYDMAGAAGVGVRGCNSKIGLDSKDFHAKLAELDHPWLSSNDKSFADGMIGGYIRGMFREPSIYES